MFTTVSYKENCWEPLIQCNESMLVGPLFSKMSRTVEEQDVNKTTDKTNINNTKFIMSSVWKFDYFQKLWLVCSDPKISL